MPLVDSTDTGSTDRTMAWFFQLDLEDRAALLADPEMELPPSLVADLSEERCVASDAVWTSQPQPTKFRLAPSSVEQLQPRRNRLLRWWNALSADEQKLLIESRDQALPERHRAILLAGEGAASNGNGLVEVLPMTRAFLEWQAYAQRQ